MSYPYRDHSGPSGGGSPTQRGGSPADYELQDYYDDGPGGIPAPHRLSGLHGASPYPSTQSLPGGGSPRQSQYNMQSSPFNDSAARIPGAGVGAGGAGYGAAGGYQYASPYGQSAPGGASASAVPFSRPRNYEHDLDQAPTGRGWDGSEKPVSARRKWFLIGGLIAVLAIVIIAVVVGVVVSRKNPSSSSATSGSSSSSNVVKQTDPNDPSTFVKDDRFHQSFYGLAYTPENSQLPNCGNKLSDVITDIQIMSQLTKRIRLYGADCNQTALVLEAIRQTKVDMKVYVGNYPIATDSNAAYDRQRDTLKSTLQTYGTDHVAGMTVGNEFMLNYLNANGGGSDPNGAVGAQGAALLIADIKDTQSTFSDMSSMVYGTSDAGSFFNTQVLEAVQYGMSNVHPWFANQSIDDAAGWTWDFFTTQNVQPASQLTNQPKMYIAETGWPTNATDPGSGSDGPSTASEANLQKFLDSFVCQANANGTGYFYFETFDEPWKTAQFGGVEGYWGMFYSNKTMKNIKIPDCAAP